MASTYQASGRACRVAMYKVESGHSGPNAHRYLTPVRLAYLAKAVSKRVLKSDCGEGIFEANDMVKWEGCWTFKLCVEEDEGSVCKVCKCCRSFGNEPHETSLAAAVPGHCHYTAQPRDVLIALDVAIPYRPYPPPSFPHDGPFTFHGQVVRHTPVFTAEDSRITQPPWSNVNAQKACCPT